MKSYFLYIAWCVAGIRGDEKDGVAKGGTTVVGVIRGVDWDMWPIAVGRIAGSAGDGCWSVAEGGGKDVCFDAGVGIECFSACTASGAVTEGGNSVGPEPDA